MLVGMLQDLLAGDDATFDCIQHHVPPALEQGTALVARNGPRLRLKEAEHLLLGGDLLALAHPAARVRDPLLQQREHLLGLGAQARGLSLRLLAQRRHHPARLLHQVLAELHELVLPRCLLGLLVFPLASHLAMPWWCHPCGGAQPRATPLLQRAHRLAEQPCGALDQAREHTHPVHESPTVGGMGDLGLDTSGIPPQLASLRHPGLPGQRDDAVVERKNAEWQTSRE